MKSLELHPGERLIASEHVQLARGFPQTAGVLHLTSERLVLLPHQLLSMGCGRVVEIPRSRIVSTCVHAPFRGGTLWGGAGRKIEVRLDDGSRTTFSFFLGTDVRSFHAALERRDPETPETAPAGPTGWSLWWVFAAFFVAFVLVTGLAGQLATSR